MTNGKSFMSRYKPTLDQTRDELVLQVPTTAVIRKSDEFYEVRLPVYAGRALAIGGNILRKPRKEYRDWLLSQQGKVCTLCGGGYEPDNPWNLDHQPPLSERGSKFIDYERTTQNRVIHRKCDSAQNRKPK